MNAERLRRRIRQHPALWGEMGEEKEKQAERILARTADRLRASWNARADELLRLAGDRYMRMME